MSESNVEMVRTAIEAYNRGDMEGGLSSAAPDFEMDLSRAVGPQHGIFGRDQMLDFFSEFTESWESFLIEPHEFIETGEDVIVPWTLHLVGRDGIEVEARVTWTWTIRDGAIARVCMYQGRQDALEAAGLRD